MFRKLLLAVRSGTSRRSPPPVVAVPALVVLSTGLLDPVIDEEAGGARCEPGPVELLQAFDTALVGSVDSVELLAESRLAADVHTVLVSRPSDAGLYVLHAFPGDEDGWGWVRLRFRRDQVPVDAAYHDAEGELVRTLRFTEVRRPRPATFDEVQPPPHIGVNPPVHPPEAR